MYCSKCGKQINDDAVFCSNCGNKVQEAAPVAPVTDYRQYPPYPHYEQNMTAGQKRTANPALIIVPCMLVLALILGGIGAFLFFAVRSDTETIIPPISIIDEIHPDTGLDDDNVEYQPSSEDEKKFIALLDRLFAEWVSEDTLTMQFFLADPEAMGITRPAPTFGEVTTPESIQREREETAQIISELKDIKHKNLSEEYQIIYDIINRSLDLSEILEEKDDYAYYTGYIKPIIGVQVQLPVLLAEFKFYTADDIEIYLQLLEDTIRYFDDIIEFERERAAKGYFLTEENLDKVIEQLETFLEESREDCFVIAVVNDKIDTYPGLTEEQREEYKTRHIELINNNVLAAYDNLLAAMKELKGKGGAAPGGLASLPDGKKVAHAMVSLRAGTDRTSEELESLVSMFRYQTLFTIWTILGSDEELSDKFSNGEAGKIPDGTAQEYMDILEEAMRSDFPVIDSIDYSISEVHESLQEFISPAFFLTPAVDKFDDNIIYINPGKIDDNLYFFTVLAHEGYPGHMYEAVYNRQLSFHPIRAMLDNTGYSEGWATYVEYLSYDYTVLSEMEALLVKSSNLFDMLIQSNIDIGVNLLGWTLEDVITMLREEVGIENEETAKSIYNHVIAMPLNSSMYTLGYIEFLLMRDEYETSIGRGFNARDFHEAILKIGPAPFDIVRTYLD